MMTDMEEVATESEVLSNPKHKDSAPTLDLSDASKQLAEGLLSIYQKPLEHIQQELNVLTSKQENCIMQTQLENKKLCDVLEDVELNELFTTLETYQKKLINIKKEVITIHDRTFKLKKRALRFQAMKHKEAKHKEQQREQELRTEEELIRKPEFS